MCQRLALVQRQVVFEVDKRVLTNVLREQLNITCAHTGAGILELSYKATSRSQAAYELLSMQGYSSRRRKSMKVRNNTPAEER